MSEVLQANVFFVITSVAVVVLTILVCVALWHVIRILKNIRDISERVKRGSEQLAEDALAVRTFVNEGVVGTVMNLLGKITQKKTSHTQKAGVKKDTKED